MLNLGLIMDGSPAADRALYQQFIFECLSARLNNSDLERAAAIARSPAFDWDLCLQVADEELVSPLLHVIIGDRHIAPRLAEAALQRKYEFINRRNLFLLHQLAATTALLEEVGIEVIVLKGAALAETIYQDIALRPMRDLDLLVERERQQEAAALLASAGYRQRTGMLGTAYPIGLSKPGIETVELELHWTLFHSLYYHEQVSMAWFWQTAVKVESAARPMRVLGPEAQILHLCGHLTLHHGDEPQLLWHNDLAQLILQENNTIAWDPLVDSARTFRLLLPLRQVLPVLAQEWGAPVPQETLQRLAATPLAEGEREAFALSTAVKRSEGEGYWLRLQEIEGWRKRLAYVLRWFVPAPEALRARYGGGARQPLLLLYIKHWGTGLRLAVDGALVGRKRKGRGRGVG